MVLPSGRPRLPCMCFSLRGTLSKRDGKAKENRQAQEKEEIKRTQIRGTQREYGSKPLKHSIVERILVFKR